MKYEEFTEKIIGSAFRVYYSLGLSSQKKYLISKEKMSTEHHHHEIPADTGVRFIITILLNFLITVVEIIGGIISGSLSLISDALHNFSDGVAVIISYIALRLRERDNSQRHTFGLKRAEILAAVINSSVLLVISLYLFYESGQRLIHPAEVQGRLMSGIAAIGLVANIIGTLLLRRDSDSSMNVRSAYLRLFSDALSSLGVLLGGLAIYFWKIYWLDPVLTILIGLYILKESYHILISAIHVLMEGAPPDIPAEKVKEVIESFEEVEDFHHLHLWMVGENDVHLEGHVNIRDMLVSESNDLGRKIEEKLKHQFEINHVTLQFECNQCQGVGLIANGDK